MSQAFQGLIGWGLQYFVSHRRDSLKSGGTQDSYTAAMKFCAVVFLVYLAIATDAIKRKKVCKQIIDKLSDLEVLIKKKQDCCLVGRVRRSFQSFTLTVHHRYQVV